MAVVEIGAARSTPSKRSVELGVLSLLLASVLAVLPTGPATAAPVVAASAAAAKGRDPQRDFTRLPKRCLTTHDKTPSDPIVCNLNWFNKSRPTLVLWGDSHMWMMIPAIKRASRGKPINLVTFIMGACPPGNPALNARTRRTASPCALTNDRAMRFVRKLQKRRRPVAVVLGSFWGLYLNALKDLEAGRRPATVNEGSARFFAHNTPRLFRWLGKKRVKVDVDAQGAAVPRDEPACRRGTFPWRCAVPRSRAMFSERSTHRFLAANVPKLAGRPRYIDVNRSICDASVCRAKRGGILTWWDRLHLSATRASTLGGYFAPTVNGLARKLRPGQRRSRIKPRCRIPVINMRCIPR